MKFKNAYLYRTTSAWPSTSVELSGLLNARRSQPCGTQDTEMRGWAPPCEGADDLLAHEVGGQWLICMQTEQRILPGAVIKQAASTRAKEIEQQQGYKPGRKQMRDITEAVRQELLPRAFTKSSKVYAWVDVKGGWLCIDASGQAKAEGVLELLCQTLNAPVARPFKTLESVPATMTAWLGGNDMPEAFSIDDDCELQVVGEGRSAVRYISHSLAGDDVRAHLEAGKVPTKLALTYNDRVSFVLTERMEIKRISLLDVVTEATSADDDAQSVFDSEFALMTGELNALFTSLLEAFGGESGSPNDHQDERVAA